ncbi:MAG: hypothetical protein IJX17_07530 [Clostridia bacterium]|nr:hypothetical protein [Clostridia bacterium]
MKTLKKLLLFSIMIFAVFTIFNSYSPKLEIKNSNAALQDIILEYMPITYRGHLLTADQIKVDEEDKNKAYVLANDTITIGLHSLKRPYILYGSDNNSNTNDPNNNINPDLLYNYDSFIVHTTDIFIDADIYTTDDTSLKTFKYAGETYYFQIVEYTTGDSSNSGSNNNPIKHKYLAIYDEVPYSYSASALVTSQNSDLLSYDVTEEGMTIHIIDSYTLAASDDKSPVEFKIKIGDENYSINFLKTIVRFANAENPIVSFDTFDNKPDNWLQKEQTFSKLNLTFLTELYEFSEDNALYFNINYNGFLYEFTLYSKPDESVKEPEIINPDTENPDTENPEIDISQPKEKFLFVTYVDKVKLNQATTTTEKNEAIYELASKTRTKINPVTEEEYIEYTNKVASNSPFELSFYYRGRYEIEIFDDTYKYGFENPNYYKTSFYIKENSTDTTSLFNNIYIISQSIDEENKPIEYIVDSSTQNHNVTTTIKNLSNFGRDDVSLTDIVSKVIVSYVKLGVAGNDPIETVYTSAEILENNMIDENGDLNFSFEIDAFYQIQVVNLSETKTITYSFSIIKQSKTALKNYKIETPFKTEVKDFSEIIESSDPIRFTTIYKLYEAKNEIPAGTPYEVSKKLDISYLNEYTISYAMEKVELSFETDEKNLVLTITCLGIGDITVEVASESEVTTYILNSEKEDSTINISEYGFYTVTLIDSMGTSTVGTYDFAKKMNTSTLILIGVSAFVAVAIGLFILSVRGKVKTR